MTPRRRCLLLGSVLVLDFVVASLLFPRPHAGWSAVGFAASAWIFGVSDPKRWRSREVDAFWLATGATGSLWLMNGNLDWLRVGLVVALSTLARPLLASIFRRCAPTPVGVLGRGPSARRARRLLTRHAALGLTVVDDPSSARFVFDARGSTVRNPEAGRVSRWPREFGLRPGDRLPIESGFHIHAAELPIEGATGRVKRVIDLFGTVLVLPIALVAAAVTGLCVRALSGAPVLYVQTRLTSGGRPFRIVKFRTMPRDAEPGGKAIWPRAEDDRITPVGRWLRRLWLDEIPQLYNVVRGDLSLVGPRPERPEFAQVFAASLTRYCLRYSTRAGMTGLAQIRGFVGNTSLRKRLACDLAYIDDWRPHRDLLILGATLCRIIGRRPSRPRFDYVPEYGAPIP